VKLVRLRANGRAASGAVDIQVLSRQAGLHPDVVRRLVRLGLLEPIGPARRGPGAELFPPDAAALLARAMRLRRDLGLNYAGAVLASELLARIDELEARLRRYEPPDPGAR
jgi:DNA-binding transcriptional MerR regulator